MLLCLLLCLLTDIYVKVVVYFTDEMQIAMLMSLLQMFLLYQAEGKWLTHIIPSEYSKVISNGNCYLLPYVTCLSICLVVSSTIGAPPLFRVEVFTLVTFKQYILHSRLISISSIHMWQVCFGNKCAHVYDLMRGSFKMNWYYSEGEDNYLLITILADWDSHPKVWKLNINPGHMCEHFIMGRNCWQI